MLEKEVYEPIGIFYAPTNRTIEPDGGIGQPLIALGYYPTIGDMVKIARLYQDHGAANGEQILYRPAIDSLSAGPEPRGLPTGIKRRTLRVPLLRHSLTAGGIATVISAQSRMPSVASPRPTTWSRP
jgi:hypothetical protein